jgi:hypothetical protein
MAKSNTNAAPAIVEQASGEAFSPALNAVENNETPKVDASSFKIVSKLANESKIAAKLDALSAAKSYLFASASNDETANYQASEASEHSEKAGAILYRAYASGLITRAEITSAIADVFGYEPKKDGTPGASPKKGRGQDIRKRIVRCADAFDYVSGKGSTDWISVIPKDELIPHLESLAGDKPKLFGTYAAIGELHKANVTAKLQAFDAKHIAKLVDQLCKDDAKATIEKNDTLSSAYGALCNRLIELELIAVETNA